jgi:peptidoglycan/xylan/chitin deacetylase (PgdA/CDA1 family)
LSRQTKSVLKVVLKKTLTATGRAREDSRILTYHSVGARDHEMNIHPDGFRAQMEWLAAQGTAIPLTQAAHGEPGVAVTFDDGYRDNLTWAAPVLLELGIPATVFVVAHRMGQLLDHDHDPETSRLMSWDEAAELASAGIKIGAHTLTHRRLSALSDEEQQYEIAESRRLIGAQLATDVAAFAYPFGTAADYTSTTVQLVQEAGFSYAVSNRYGPNPQGACPWTLRRIWIDSTDTIESFQAKVDGRLDRLSLLDSSWGVRGRRQLNRWLGLH